MIYRYCFLLIAFIANLTLLGANTAWSSEKLRLKLHWIAHAEFAGAFVAKEKGWYADEGIDLEIIPRGIHDDDIVAGLAGDKYDIAMDIGSVVINARARGVPVRAFAAKFQSSPLGLLSLKESGITSIADLKGKVIGFYVLSDLWILDVMLKSQGLKLSDVLLKKIGTDYNELKNGGVDSLFAFEMMEPVIMKLIGLDPVFFKSEDYGFVSYGSVYFAKDDFIKKNKHLLAKFLRATFKGWRHVFEHPEEATNLVMKKYFPRELLINNDMDLTAREQLLYCKLIRRYMVKGVGEEALGYMNSVVWDKTIAQMKEANVLMGNVQAGDVYTLDVLDGIGKNSSNLAEK